MPHTQSPLKLRIRNYALAGFAGGLVFALLHTLSALEKNYYLQKEQQAATSYGVSLQVAVDRELNSLLFVSNGLASYLTVYKDELNPLKINAILEDLWKRTKHVRNLGIAVGYRMTYVYPIKGNEKILGVDFRSIPRQWAKVKLAVDSHQGILDGPIDLIQGGSGIVFRYPIYIEGRYWGILSTVINSLPFLEAAFQHNQTDEYALAIRTENKKVFYGNPELFKHAHIVLIESNVPNGKWQWAIEKRDLAYPQYFYLMDVFSVVLSLTAIVGVYHYTRERYSLKRAALIDSLTNLPNRRYLERKLLEASVEADQNRMLICAMLIDLDHFKNLNDTYGHAFGDAALVMVAKKIQSIIRDTDTLGRLGGDEFLLLLCHMKSLHDAEIIASKIMQAFEEPQEIMGKITRVSLSIGLTISSMNEPVDIKRIMSQADEALYLAKGEGRGRYKVFST